MHDWRREIVGHAAMMGLLVQNLLLEGTISACEEAIEAAEQLYDCLACARRPALAELCEQEGQHETRQVFEGM